MIIFRHNTLLLLLLIISASSFGQVKKLDQNYKTNKDVVINIDARHTNISFETWDRNEVQIEAFLDGNKLNEADTKALLDTWKLETSGNATQVKINSGGGPGRHVEMDMASLTESLGHLQNLIAPIMTEMVAPMLDNIAKHPPLPPDFAAKMGNLNFDYEAYQKDGDKYIKKWEQQIEKNFGKDFEASMEKWAEQFEKNAEVWGKNMEKEMELNGKDFEKSMEAWGEKFGAEMAKWGESFAREMEGMENMEDMKRMEGMKKMEHMEHPMAPNHGMGSKSNRHIKIKMPSNAKLELEVRHGAVKLGDRTTNLKADLSHSSLEAKIIDGLHTNVRASYSPIAVSQWNYGVLKTRYIKNGLISKAHSIKLESNSSDITIGELSETGILSGTFGSLKIGKLSPNFKNLDITVQNSDLRLSLPQTAFNFKYNGTQSEIEYPRVNSVKATTSYDSEMLNGFYQNASSNRNLSINATFSDIIIK